MYIGYLEDRKNLGFSAIKDSSSSGEFFAILLFGYYISFTSLTPSLDNFNVVGTYQTETSTVLEKESSMIAGSHQEDEIVDSPSVVSLISRGGGVGKSGPGARAKADACRNFKAKGSGSSIIPGANGYTPQNVYCRYHGNRASSCKATFGRELSPRIAPSVSPNR